MSQHGCDLLLIFPPIRAWDTPRNFPSGIGLIAAEVRQAGYRVHVIDANGLRPSDKQVLVEIEELNPAVIGIGGLITTYAWVKRVTKLIKQQRPATPIVLGGSVGSSIVDTALNRTSVDIIAIGEADNTMLELLPALIAQAPIDDIAGLAFLRDGATFYSPPRELLQDLDSLPYPAWDLFPMDVYLENPVVGVGKDIDIISSRGCPFNCQYCYKIFGRRFRGRSAQHVVGEMEELKRLYDVDFISIQDDCFVIDKQRVYDICDLVDASAILKDIRWSCNGRVTVCDRPLVQRMRDSGCISVAYGMESGSPTILKNMQKAVTLDQAADALECSRAAGVRTPLAFMFGYPGETRETAMETVAFAKRLNIPLTSLTFTCPYPGTQLYNQLRADGKLTMDEEELVFRMGDAIDLTVNLTDMTDEELIDLRQEALDLARANYTAPTPQEVEAQERSLYGDRLYEMAQKQLKDPRMKAHRQRHGFNEGQRADKAKDPDAEGLPLVGWTEGRISPYIIAEAGINHNGRLPLALELVEAARQAGAHCVKFQAFSAEELNPNASSENTHAQWDMLKRYELSPNAFITIKKRCDELGLDFLATPFSTQWVRVLTDIGATAIKIDSGNLCSGSLLDVIGQTGLPVVCSTRMSGLHEIDTTLARLLAAGSNHIALLQCVSLYPTRIDQANLRAVHTLAQHTKLPVGFSDHTNEIITGAHAVAVGAMILEKHFTLDRNLEGPDHHASLEPEQMRQYIAMAQQAQVALGNAEEEPLQEEMPIKQLLQSGVVATRFIKAGTIITADMFAGKDLAGGISSDQIASIIGAKARRDIAPDMLLAPDFIQIDGS